MNLLLAARVIDPISIPDALLLSLVGFTVVFIALVALMIVIKVLTTLSGVKKAEPALAAAAPVVSAPPSAVSGERAPGSAGEIDLHTVDNRTAALIMAIVADELKTPLCELRFTSIKEVREEPKK